MTSFSSELPKHVYLFSPSLSLQSQQWICCQITCQIKITMKQVFYYYYYFHFWEPNFTIGEVSGANGCIAGTSQRTRPGQSASLENEEVELLSGFSIGQEAAVETG